MTGAGAPLKLAIIGAGVMGRNYLRAAQAAGIPVAFITDANLDAAAQAAAPYNCAVLANPKPSDMDAAVIAVPTAHHAAVALPLLKAHVHCLVEKPFVACAAEGAALIAAAKNAVLQVGHIERFNPAVEALSAHNIDPARITSLTARRMGPASARVTDISIVVDLMVHDLDIVLALKPMAVAKIEVTGTADHAEAKLTFADGAVADLIASRTSQMRVRTLDITTKDGDYRLDYIAKSLLTAASSAQNAYIGDALGAELAHFVACIKNKARPRVSGETALAVMNLTWRIEAALGKAA
ncbi:MAG: Gfo/Idh/MocA family oxidoreductase [Rhodospirillaceae bacterium]|nr:Gfo/Idh/MocA family oxidoreductase [Rhodospirillaceae bacterium]